MKGKLVIFASALMAVATIGVVQLQTSAAEPGQVGNAPRCNVEVKGQRASAFTVNDAKTKATVDFSVKGAENCKVQVSGNSFYAQSIDGTPYEKQVLFDRKTKELTKGDYSITVNLPTKSTKQKGCFYQIDLTYGTHNVTPVLAYGHGKIKDCGEPKPTAKCVSLVATMQERTKYMLTATASANNGAKIKSYTFVTTKDGQPILNNTYENTATSQSVVYQNLAPGEYHAKVTVKTSDGEKTGADCKTTFTVAPEPTTPTPGIDIQKIVTVDPNSPKFARVNENVEFSYKISVINTGNTDLEGVTVTDTPDRGITLLRIEPPLATIENNSFVIRNMKLLKGETRTFVVYAKVPVAQAGRLTNTVCVDAPTVPGNPDKCDKAEVEVPPTPVPGKVRVCDSKSGNIIEVPEDQKGNYEPENSPSCGETTTPPELPETGPVETTLSVIGAMSLVGSAAYYVASRRQA